MNQATDPKDAPLTGHRLVEMNPDTRRRILDAARSAWSETPSPRVSWGMPVLRLAACLVLSVMMVLAANRIEPTPIAHQSRRQVESLSAGGPMSFCEAVRHAVAAKDDLRRFCGAYVEQQRLLRLGFGAVTVVEND